MPERAGAIANINVRVSRRYRLLILGPVALAPKPAPKTTP